MLAADRATCWTQDRRRAVHQAVAARRVPQPRLLRRHADVDLDRHRQRPADRRHGAVRSWRRSTSSSCNGRNGASISRPRARPARSADMPAAEQLHGAATTTGATTDRRRARDAIWRRDAGDPGRPGLPRSAPSPGVLAAGRRSATALHNVPEKAIYQLGSGRAFRHLPARHLLVRRDRHAGRGRRAMRARNAGSHRCSRYIVRRLLVMIPTLLAISFIVFVIIQLPPGDYLDHHDRRAAQPGRGGRPGQDRSSCASLRPRPAVPASNTSYWAGRTACRAISAIRSSTTCR